MRVLIVGNVLKDVYLNLDTRAGGFEVDKNGVKYNVLKGEPITIKSFGENIIIGK